jgi:hypothetical protein
MEVVQMNAIAWILLLGFVVASFLLLVIASRLWEIAYQTSRLARAQELANQLEVQARRSKPLEQLEAVLLKRKKDLPQFLQQKEWGAEANTYFQEVWDNLLPTERLVAKSLIAIAHQENSDTHLMNYSELGEFVWALDKLYRKA